MAIYTIEEGASATWANTMSLTAYKTDGAVEGADGDIFNFSSDGGAHTPSAGNVPIFDNNVTWNAADNIIQLAGATQDKVVNTDKTGFIMNGGTIDGGGQSCLEFGVDNGAQVPTATINDVVCRNCVTNQGIQNFAAAIITYNNCEGHGNADDGLSLHDSSVITDNGGFWHDNTGEGVVVTETATYTGSNVTIQDNGLDFQCTSGTSATNIILRDSYIKGAVLGNSGPVSDVTALFERVIFDCKSAPPSPSNVGSVHFGRTAGDATPVNVIFRSCEFRKPPITRYSIFLQGDATSTAVFENCSINHNIQDAYGIRIDGTDITATMTNTNIYNTFGDGSNAAIRVQTSNKVTLVNTNFDRVFRDFQGTPLSSTNETTVSGEYIDSANDNFNVVAPNSPQMSIGSSSVLPLTDLNNTEFRNPPAIGSYTYLLPPLPKTPNFLEAPLFTFTSA